MIYADHAATTQLSLKAREAMLPWLGEEYGNPSTLYRLARNPRRAISDARIRIAEALGAAPEEIYFTSGGTESDNWALLGTALRFPGQRKRIITSCIEHHAVLHSCSFLEELGHEIVRLPVNREGLVHEANLKGAINANTILVSIMAANNEIGTIEPIRELSAVAHAWGVPFHTDAVQAVGHIPLDVCELDIDMLSASAHKFNGPKGVGFLYVRNGTPLASLIRGGGQENGMRSGTENVAGIVGMATALEEHMSTMERDARHLEALEQRILKGLHTADINFLRNGADRHIPGSLSLSFRGKDGEAILNRMDLMGIAIATGSACNSKETVLSHVIQAIEIPDVYAHGTIRITLGTDNTEKDAEQIVGTLCRILTS